MIISLLTKILLSQVEFRLFAGGFFDPRGALEGGGTEAGHLDGGAGEQCSDGEDLDAGVFFLPDGGVVKSCLAGGGDHFGGGFFEGDEDAKSGFLVLDGANQVADVAGFDMSGFDLDNGGAGFAFGVVNEGDDAVDAAVGAFFALSGGWFAANGLGFDEGERPPLELVAVILGKLAGGCEVEGFADDIVILAGFEVEHVFEAGFVHGNGEMGDVNADPAAVEFLSGGDGSAAAGEGVEYDITGVGGGEDDTLQQGKWFLGGVAEALGFFPIDELYISPVVKRQPPFIEIPPINLSGLSIYFLFVFTTILVKTDFHVLSALTRN